MRVWEKRGTSKENERLSAPSSDTSAQVAGLLAARSTTGSAARPVAPKLSDRSSVVSVFPLLLLGATYPLL